MYGFEASLSLVCTRLILFVILVACIYALSVRYER